MLDLATPPGRNRNLSSAKLNVTESGWQRLGIPVRSRKTVQPESLAGLTSGIERDRVSPRRHGRQPSKKSCSLVLKSLLNGPAGEI